MSNTQYYILVYYEFGHEPKYFLSSRTHMHSKGFSTIDELYSYASKQRHIGRNHINTEIDLTLLNEIKKNLHYEDSEEIMRISDLKKILSTYQ